VVRLLQADPDLAAGLSPEEIRRAMAVLRSEVRALPPGAWLAPRGAARASYGFLVLDGLLQRRVDHGLGVARELLGPGDVVRPQARAASLSLLSQDASWTVLQPARLAVLDERLTALIGRFPGLMVELAERQHHRAQCLAHMLAISHLPRVEDRLLATLWYLAERWGRVTAAGVTVPLVLTHEALGELVGAQRSSVTLAVSSLRDEGRLTRGGDGAYVLLGDAPGRADTRAVAS
jgi:CRP-like cAMP-binding protein